jgi:hypothetical protein
MISVEVPNRDQAGAVREAQRALYLQRTAQGTIDDDGDFQLSETTLKQTGGLLHTIEVARLRAGLTHYVRYIQRVNGNGGLTLSEIQHELHEIAVGLQALLDSTPEAGS